eukprot:6969064-Pyramimonas_sp.AAC.1
MSGMSASPTCRRRRARAVGSAPVASSCLATRPKATPRSTDNCESLRLARSARRRRQRARWIASAALLPSRPPTCESG